MAGGFLQISYTTHALCKDLHCRWDARFEMACKFVSCLISVVAFRNCVQRPESEVEARAAQTLNSRDRKPLQLHAGHRNARPKLNP